MAFVTIEDQFGEVGRLYELAQRFGLTEESIVAKVKKVLKG